ncbi:R3H and coiled-coil domain-containing protein 1 isoform X1 [Solanum tuberosum]|uniref:Coiled-coil domain-containing protein R3HCC1L n=1 Tax=Solanum tuberosum TaxID=4113 RepID=M1A5L1_SOLTU|nr:PREDICTED: R3H and coiled-coil domain-containing protein 1 isoform X1 [Solanum tuberosum]
MDSDTNWSEKVEDLVDAGEINEAISLLEELVAKLEFESQNSSNSQLRLSTALLELSKLYSTQGLSLRADQTRSKAFLIKQQQENRNVNATKESTGDGISGSRVSQSDNKDHASLQIYTSQNDEDDDWEAIADRAPDELLSPQHLPEVSKISLQDSKVQAPKRRGRGTFSYQKQSLYSDQQSDEPAVDDIEDETVSGTPEGSSDTKNLNYGTRHVLVLADFPPSTKTNDLEKLLEKFKDDVAIRWVNDTVALAVFRTPALALEASNSIHCPFTVRVLCEENELLSSIPPRDLEPPRRRPQTSARTAQRLIAQSMGIKLPCTDFGSREYRRQEEARKNRIVSRQNLKNDAWGDDDN